jgi:hypothetical protein
MRLSMQLTNIESAAVTPSGVLLLGAQKPAGLFAVHPVTGQCKAVAGTRDAERVIDGVGLAATFFSPAGIVVVPSECCAYVTDALHFCIRRVTLPAHWCVPPASGSSNRTQRPIRLNLCVCVCVCVCVWMDGRRLQEESLLENGHGLGPGTGVYALTTPFESLTLKS